VLIDQLTPEEEAYFKKFDTVWRSYFDQSPDVWLKFLIPGDNTKNSIKSIDSHVGPEFINVKMYLCVVLHLYQHVGMDCDVMCLGN